jgi:hypothetical protein
MMAKFVGKLVELESELRLLREKTLLQRFETERKDLSEIDLSSLDDITPIEWRRWFTEPLVSAPTELPRYGEILPNLMVGFPETDIRPARIQQQPYMDHKGALRQSLNIWLANPAEWFTVELLIPIDMVVTYPDLYIAWTCAISTSQYVGISVYQTNDSLQNTHMEIGREFLPAINWSVIIPVHFSDITNITQSKLVFTFSTNFFQSIRFDNIRLYAAKSNKNSIRA